ncbi:MAG: TetR/AcrR family transcriptional regulator [Acidobacteria bacterium]|nr:TetR/AcrR family transcriptional regulator [Acidobacteriota bacterium]
MAIAVGGTEQSSVTAVTSVVRPVEPVSNEDRALDALFDCVLRWGLSKTTVDDVARAAGISRATLYRLFPGGKAAMVQAGTRRMVTELADSVAADLHDAADLGDALTRAIVSARRFLSDDEALQLLLEHDPASVQAQLALGSFDQVLDAAAGAMGPALAPFAGSAERGAAASVWAARLLVSYLTDPTADDLGDPAVAGSLVHDFFLPGFAPQARSITHPSTDPARTSPDQEVNP